MAKAKQNDLVKDNVKATDLSWLPQKANNKRLSKDKLFLYRMSKEQEENLIKLVKGLERLLPTHEHLFEMAAWVGGEKPNFDKFDYNANAEKATIAHPCGTSACAVGFAPSCGIPKDSRMQWCDFSEEAFGGFNSIQHDENVNQFMFSHLWSNPNVSEMREAIARIKLVLAGKAPEKFDYTETYA